MFRTLQAKLLVGLTPLVAIMVVLGIWAITMFQRLGGKIDVILRENYVSVLAAEGMKEALERMDSALLFAIGGDEDRGQAQFREYRPRFEGHLRVERGNITLPDEREMAEDLTALLARYVEESSRFFALPREARDERARLYFGRLLPTFDAIKARADDVLELNQKNMEEEDRRARQAAAMSVRLMVGALVGAAAAATVVALILGRSILGPVREVTLGARALTRRELDQVVAANTRDELGELAQAFNTLARTIREYRQAGTARLLRAQKTAQATIDSFPDPVVVVDINGGVERANPAPRRLLGAVASEGVAVHWAHPPAVRPLLEDVLAGQPDVLPTNLEHAIAFRDDS